LLISSYIDLILSLFYKRLSQIRRFLFFLFLISFIQSVVDPNYSLYISNEFFKSILFVKIILNLVYIDIRLSNKRWIVGIVRRSRRVIDRLDRSTIRTIHSWLVSSFRDSAISRGPLTLSLMSWHGSWHGKDIDVVDKRSTIFPVLF